MDKVEIEKNRLELSYRRCLGLLNIVLLIGAGSFVAYFASLILNPEKIYHYSSLIAIIDTNIIFIGK